MRTSNGRTAPDVPPTSAPFTLRRDNADACAANEFTRRVKISLASIGCWQHLCVNRCVPSAEAILAGLTTIANEWWIVAVFWHAYVAVLLLAIAARPDRSVRLLGRPARATAVVGQCARMGVGNPFNGVIFAGLSFTLATIVRKLPARTIRIASGPPLLLGLVFVAFGWAYRTSSRHRTGAGI